MAIQIRRGNDSEWESNKSNIVAGEPAVTLDSERMFVGTGSGTYMELANLDVLADAFDSSASYEVGDFVAYHGKVYKCNTAHSGAWNASDFDEVALADALDSLGEDVYTKAEADALLALKANASDVNSALALKADKSDTYTKTEVNTALDLKADKSNTYTKTQVDTALNLKSDKDDTYTKTEVNTALALKADKTTTYTKTEVDSALTLKADKSDTYTKTQVDSALEDYAKVDGFYEGMTVGNAEQLVTNLTDTESEPFTFRTSGGNLEIGDREELTVVGGSVVWNQLVRNGNFETDIFWNKVSCTSTVSNNIATVVPTASTSCLRHTMARTENHKYLVYCEIKSSSGNGYVSWWGGAPIVEVAMNGAWTKVGCISNATSSSTSYNLDFGVNANINQDTWQIRNCNCIDLTQMFGSTIADYIYNLEQSTAGAGVAFFKKYFPKNYYPYNAGEMLHVQTSEFKTVGFNQWDTSKDNENSVILNDGTLGVNGAFNTSDYIRVLPSVTYYFKDVAPSANAISIAEYDADKNFIRTQNVSGASGTNASGTKDMSANTYYVRVARFKTSNEACINLHWDGTRDGEYEPYTEHSYPLDDSLTLRGIPKLDADNNLYYDGDTYEHDGTVTRKYGIVDLGTLDWTFSSPVFYVSMQNYTPKPKYQGGLVCPLYTNRLVALTNPVDMSIFMANNQNVPILRVADSRYTDATSFKSAMSGVYLVYELVEPTTENAEPYQTPQIVDNWGTEEFVVPTQSGVEIPVGHETVYPISLRDKLESAPNLPDGDGDYLLHMESGEATYKQLVSEFPSAPTTDGSYVLKATVSSGTATLTWVAE